MSHLALPASPSPDKIYDFASSSKELEKKEQAARLAALQRQRRNELAAVVKAVENEASSALGALC
jgi:hypothetical protein